MIALSLELSAITDYYDAMDNGQSSTLLHFINCSALIHDGEEPMNDYCEVNGCEHSRKTAAFKKVYGFLILILPTLIIMWKVYLKNTYPRQTVEEAERICLRRRHIKDLVFALGMCKFLVRIYSSFF